MTRTLPSVLPTEVVGSPVSKSTEPQSKMHRNLNGLRRNTPLARWLGCVVLLGLVACDDGGNGAATAQDARVVDARIAPDASRDASPADATVPDARTPQPDQGTECQAGERLCPDEGGRGLLVCGIDGRWAVERCQEGEICQRGDCIADPRLCREGQRTCLDVGTIGVCQPGVGFTAGDTCPEGTVCSGEGRCLNPECAAAEGFRSYLGCDFLAVDLPNIAWAPFGGTPDSPLGVVVANPDLDAPVHVTVEGPDGTVAPLVAEITVRTVGLPFDPAMPVAVRTEVWDGSRQVILSAFAEADGLEIPPGGMAVLLLPHFDYYPTTRVRKHARRIRTDRPVAAYQFGPYCCNYSYSNDASLLYPVPTLGTRYINVGVPAWSDVMEDDPGNPNPPGDDFTGLSATLSIVAATDDTQVQVELPADVEVLPEEAGRIQRQGQTLTMTLQANELVDILSRKAHRRPGFLPLGMDLTGVRVTASKAVSVFSGHECSFYPQDQGACDHLEEQLLPTDTWGTRFALVPPILRTRNPAAATEAIYWKIVGEPNTRVGISRPFFALDPRRPGFEGVPDCRDQLINDTTIDLGAHGYCEFGTRAAVLADADRPIMVMGIISGQDSTGALQAFGAHAGDPAIYLVPPESQFRISYSFLAPGTFFNDYLTVIADSFAAITLDGVPVDLSNAVPVAGSTYVYVHVPIADGPHRVDGDRPFGILVFAFDDYVSYAFTGGLNLNKR